MNGVANGVYGGDLPNQINTPWIDFSEQSTIVGWSSFTTKIIRYRVVGKIVFVHVDLAGTSNSVDLSITLPFNPSSIYTSGFVTNLGISANNGANLIGYLLGTVNSNILSGRYAASYFNVSATYTASGTKTMRVQFFYEI
tara:strand:+ start:60 stop:479 length:420 start_codon:yes stop_codon:yes gene_type:complete